MALTPSTMLKLGTPAPDFSLPSTQGKTVSLSDMSGAAALLVMFLCNHCPYVLHVRDLLAELVKEYQPRGLYAVGISANDVGAYPADGFEEMKAFARASTFSFPYLYDESQEVAKAYQAACTPDFFLFDAARTLAYRGQLDGSRPGNSVPLTGANLRAALEAVLAGRKADPKQLPSMGCNIKWKPGEAPKYVSKKARA